MFLIMIIVSTVISFICLTGNKSILKMVISAMSFPFLGIYNAGAALFRSMGNSKISMKVSLCMNIINIAGNAILVYGFSMSVAGVAISSLVSRVIAAVIMSMLVRKQNYPVHIEKRFHLGYNPKIIKRILRIGIPNGLENSMFQIGKILVLGLVASLGKAATAANAVTNTIAGIEIIPGVAIGLALVTVVGQCVGNDDREAACRYTKRLLKITYISMFAVNVIIIILSKTILNMYNLSLETSRTEGQLIIFHSICCIFIWPISFALPNALRAANDVKFTMVIDWMFRSICFVIRFIRGKLNMKYF